PRPDLHYQKTPINPPLCRKANAPPNEFRPPHNVPHRHTSKLVVAADHHEGPELLTLKKKGEDNGVNGLRLITSAEIRAREPHIRGTAALEVPSTGILSAEDYVRTFARLAVDRGANLVTHARVTALESKSAQIRTTVRIGDEDDTSAQIETIDARCVINAAGLFADEVAALLGNSSWRIYPVRGEYCEIRGGRADLIQSLVYPLPHADGLSLGVHFTKTLWGTVLLGPSATYVDTKDNYERDRLPIKGFAESAQALLPEVKEEDLQLGYSGLRPKLAPSSHKGIVDFIITRDPQVPQAIPLVGIEPPGLTAAAAIARHVAALVSETLQ